MASVLIGVFIAQERYCGKLSDTLWLEAETNRRGASFLVGVQMHETRLPAVHARFVWETDLLLM